MAVVQVEQPHRVVEVLELVDGIEREAGDLVRCPAVVMDQVVVELLGRDRLLVGQVVPSLCNVQHGGLLPGLL